MLDGIAGPLIRQYPLELWKQHLQPDEFEDHKRRYYNGYNQDYGELSIPQNHPDETPADKVRGGNLVEYFTEEQLDEKISIECRLCKKNDYAWPWEDLCEECKQDEAKERERISRERKKSIFSRNNTQDGFSKISMAKKDKVWNETGGYCSICRGLGEGFWWSINPILHVKILCEDCAFSLELIEKTSPVKNKLRSRHISSDVKRKVFARDKGMCVECGVDENIHYDHIIPFSKGGSNGEKNIQLLCEKCNLRKSNKIQ